VRSRRPPNVRVAWTTFAHHSGDAGPSPPGLAGRNPRGDDPGGRWRTLEHCALRHDARPVTAQRHRSLVFVRDRTPSAHAHAQLPIRRTPGADPRRHGLRTRRPVSASQRPASPAEIAVVEAALAIAPISHRASFLRRSVHALRVQAACDCGCASVDFEIPPEPGSCRLVADGVGRTPTGGRVGVLVWALDDRVSGLEVYDLGAGQDDRRLPLPSSIQPSPESASWQLRVRATTPPEVGGSLEQTAS